MQSVSFFFFLSLLLLTCPACSMTQLSICCLWSGLDDQTPLLTWQACNSFINLIRSVSLFVWFLYLFLLSVYPPERADPCVLLLGCPSLLEPTVAEWQREISRDTLPPLAPPFPVWPLLHAATPRRVIGRTISKLAQFLHHVAVMRQ